MSIALLAAQAQHVQPFGRHAAPKRFADPMHPALQGHVLVLTEIARHVLDVAARTHQHVALDRRIAIEKNEDLVILEDHFVFCTLVRVTVGNEADKHGPSRERRSYASISNLWLATGYAYTIQIRP